MANDDDDDDEQQQRIRQQSLNATAIAQSTVSKINKLLTQFLLENDSNNNKNKNNKNKNNKSKVCRRCCKTNLEVVIVKREHDDASWTRTMAR